MDSSRSSTSDATKVDYGVLSVSIPKDHSMELSDTDFTTSPASEASQQYSHASRVKRTASYTDFHRLSQQSLKQQQQQQSRGHQRRKSNSGGAVVSVHEATMNGGALSSLEGYTLISRIGEGAFSTVYQARNEITGEHVAIKAISKSGMTAVQTANVRKEVAIMESLQHPRIIKLLEYREARDYHYLIMELAPGGEMFERVLELTYLSERLARHVIIQVAEAVKHMHANGIVQRDLKLENVVFEPMPIFPSNIAEKQRQGDTRQKKPEGAFIPGVGAGGIGRVKLIDFGLSKVVWNQATRTPCGTTGYAAPEIVRDEMYTKSVDMWGLGCMLYAMICGFPPFYDEDVKVLTRKVAMGQYEFLSPWWDDVNPMVKHLIRNLLELDPRRRYTIDDFMNHPWIREGLEEMYGNQFLADTARASVDRRRNNIRRNATHAKLTSALSINPSGQFSPRQNMKHAYDLAYAVCRLDNDAIAHQKFAKTPAWDATFGDSLNLGPADHAMDGQHSTQRPQQPQQNHSNSVGRNRGLDIGRTLPKTPLWVDIQAMATPIQQRHCWQGTLGSPIDVQAAEADFSLLSRALETQVAAERHVDIRTRKAATLSVSSTDSTSSGTDFTLNMSEGTLLKRRCIA